LLFQNENQGFFCFFEISIQENVIVDEHVVEHPVHHEQVDLHHHDDSMLLFYFQRNRDAIFICYVYPFKVNIIQLKEIEKIWDNETEDDNDRYLIMNEYPNIFLTFEIDQGRSCIYFFVK
jgi:hypothetical protein